jgi:hypothetical protein
MPITVSEINNLFSKMPIQWCIAGGWALDLHLCKETRKHADIDVIITREEHLIVNKYLSTDWVLYKAEQGKLNLWEDEEYLNTTNDIWVSKSNQAPCAFQLMLIDTEDGSWIYKKNKSVNRPIDDIFLKTDDGIHIQLLRLNWIATMIK